MSESPEKKAYIDHLMKMAVERWGANEVEQLRSALERTANAVWMVESFKLELDEEPAHPAGGR